MANGNLNFGKGYEREEKLPTFKPSIRLVEVISVSIIILLIVIISLFTRTKVQECSDDICFLQKAQACESAYMLKGEVGSVARYEIVDNCVLRKSIEKFGATEPVEIVNLFSGKYMDCPYTENMFDETLILNLVSGITECSGPLKDSIYELKIAQLELLQ